MKKTSYIVALLFIFCVVLVTGSKAQKKTVTNPDLPVTTIISDADASVAPVFQIRSDGAVYSNSNDVQSLIQGSGIGDWVMQSDFSTTSTRTVFVDLSQPIAGSCPTCPNGNPIPLASRLYQTRFSAKCHEYNNNMFTLPYLATMACPLYTMVDVNGQNYQINMNPLSGAQAYYPETNYVNITCTRLNSSSVTWSGKLDIEFLDYFSQASGRIICLFPA